MIQILISLILIACFVTVAAIVFWSIRQRGSRYRLKKDYGLSDQQIDDRLGGSTTTEQDLKTLDREKKRKAG